jgi:anti-sigma regulatory factor (Ser/Thr protein kinase)
MTVAAPQIPSSGSIWIRGGGRAPERARRYVLGQLEGLLPASTASDAALVVSELVTNSVVHAKVGAHASVSLELTMLEDRLRIAVTDPGSELEPKMLGFDPTTPGGFGLRLVDAVSCAWGVARDAAGATRVWCDLPLQVRVLP